MNTAINIERLKELENIDLLSGSHANAEINKQMCIMEAVDYVTGGKGTDHPACACEFMTKVMIRHNDRWNDEERQLLKPLIPLLVGTRDGMFKKRAQVMASGSINKLLPIFLGAVGLNEMANEFKTLKIESGPEAKTAILKAREAIRALPRAYANVNADAYANVNADAYADADAYANANAYADANAYAYAYANAYAYADADANADANAYAYAYAKLSSEERKTKREAMRKEVVAITIEIMREALLIKAD